MAVIGLVAVCVAACGSSSDSSQPSASSAQADISSPSSAQQAGTSSSAQQADTAAATKAIAPFEGQTSAFPVDEPLSKPLPASTKFVYLQCAATSCGQVNKFIQSAVKTLGGTLTTVSAGASASSFQTAAASALSLKPAVVFLDGFQPALFGDSLKQLSAAGIKVVSISMAQTPEELASYGITFNYIGTDFNANNGKLMADWVIAKKGANSNIAFYGVPEITFSAPMETAFQQELKKNCASCKVRIVPVAVATLGTTAPQTVVTDLQAHPDTDVAVFSVAPIASGLPAAMKSAGLTATTLGFSPGPGNLQDIKTGNITGGLAIDTAVSVWTMVDAAGRLVLGDEPTAAEKAGESPEQFLQQKDIIFDPANGWTAYPDYAQRFTKLWHP